MMESTIRMYSSATILNVSVGIYLLLNVEDLLTVMDIDIWPDILSLAHHSRSAALLAYRD